jgi:hypothetical protein
MKILATIILEIFLVVNVLQPIPGVKLLESQGDNQSLRRIRAPFQVPAELVLAAVEERLNEVALVYESVAGQNLFDIAGDKYKLHAFGSNLDFENYGESGIRLADPALGFEAIITADKSKQTLRIDLPALSGGGNGSIVFYSDGSAEIRAVFDGKTYQAKVLASSEILGLNPRLRIENIARDPIIHQPVIITMDQGNYFAPGHLVPFMARVEQTARNVLVTDEKGNIVTDAHGNLVPVYNMYQPELPVGNPNEGAVARLQAIEDDLHKAIKYADNYIYEGDPNNIIAAGKAALLAKNYYEAALLGRLPYPINAAHRDATDRLYDIVKSVIKERLKFEPISQDPTPQQIDPKAIVDILPYDLRVQLLSLHTNLVTWALTHPQDARNAHLPTSPDEIDRYIVALATALGPISVVGILLHPSQTSHDHWQGFIVRAVQLMGSVIYDSRMATMPDFLSQAIRFLAGDDKVVVIKRINQILQERGITNPLMQQMVSDIIGRSKSNPIVPLPYSPGGVATMAASYEYSRADIRFDALLGSTVVAASLLPFTWGIQSIIPPLAVGLLVSGGIYALFNKVIAPAIKEIKTGVPLSKVMQQAAIGAATLPADWLLWQPLALLMPYMLAKNKIRDFADSMSANKNTWGKPINPTIPNLLDPQAKAAFIAELKKGPLAAFERMMDIFMANAVVPAAGLIYANTLFQLMGPAWMWIGLPQILGWTAYPISLNTFLRNKYERP